DANQQLARRSFEEQFGALIRDPPAPFQRTLFEWPLRSRENVFAAPLPAGPATDVYERVFNRLRPRFV
ncbi:MAG TPA: hypothetical protein VGE52_08190, partial [Pirellulales bacterium]